MALEWIVVAYAAGAEAMMLLLLTLPGSNPLRHGLLSVTKTLLKPFLSILPFCFLLLLDIYWKYETMPSCKTLNSCSPSENLRHQKSTVKSQRNALLIAAAVAFYWLLYSVTKLVDRVEQLQFQIKKSVKKE
ncbi:BCR-ASSOCIATED PROTEIN BAP [Salix viminalis]|uniref:Endoplasmic reticulum transmembrane protein n=1 Tax=Salix viminalis TaxID=40686 RepID=A0A9Q0NWC8_SALVM|nr:BCR-ASSOCIATED PROTEIN BAP [Salix viminalis]